MSAHLTKSPLLPVVLLVGTVIGCSSPFAPVDVGDCSPRLAEEGQWSFLGLDGVSITSLAETPWGLFVGSDSGVFRCHPESGRWQHVGLENHGVSSMVFLAGPTPRLLVGMDRHGEGAPWHAIYATENAGRTWIVRDLGLAGQPPDDHPRVYSLAVDPGDPDRVFAGTTGSIAQSTNGGLSWEWSFGDERAWGIELISIAVSSHGDGRVWVGGVHQFGYALIHRTSDWGVTWNSSDPTPGQTYNVVRSLAVDELISNRIWAGTSGGALHSDDYGATWNPMDLSPDPGQPIGKISDVLVEGNRIYAVGGTIPSESSEISLAVSLSVDNGTTWRRVETPSGATGASVAALLSGSGLVVAISEGGGIWQYTPDT